jgi:hypothetical protein
MSARDWVLLAFAFTCACDKSRADTRIDTTATSSSGGNASVLAAAPLNPSDAAATRAVAGWRGSYKSTAGVLYVPADWKDVHWNVKESAAGIGEGTMVLTIDPVSGRVLGVLDGPLGPATVDGFASDRKLAATISRRDPTDQGFTGTLIGSLGGDSANGTMNVSPADASAIRTAMFTLSPGGSQAASR